MRVLEGRRALVTGASRSDQASFLTGATLAVDGGMLAGTPPFSTASRS